MSYLLVPPSTFWGCRRFSDPFTNFSYWSRRAAMRRFKVEFLFAVQPGLLNSQLSIWQGNTYKALQLLTVKKYRDSSRTELLSCRRQDNWRNAVYKFLYGERKGATAAPGSRRKLRFGSKLKDNNSGVIYWPNDFTAHAYNPGIKKHELYMRTAPWKKVEHTC